MGPNVLSCRRGAGMTTIETDRVQIDDMSMHRSHAHITNAITLQMGSQSNQEANCNNPGNRDHQALWHHLLSTSGGEMGTPGNLSPNLSEKLKGQNGNPEVPQRLSEPQGVTGLSAMFYFGGIACFQCSLEVGCLTVWTCGNCARHAQNTNAPMAFASSTGSS